MWLGMGVPYFVLLDDGQKQAARLYQSLCGQDELLASELVRLDQVLAAGWARGWHAVLWAGYDFGRVLMGLPESDGSHPPLSVFWFAQCQTLSGEADIVAWLHAQQPAVPTGLCRVASDTDADAYARTIAAIQAAIARGETYQINYTTRLHFEAYGTMPLLYQRLRQRQPVPYGALAYLPVAGSEEGAGEWTLCLSPELFLEILPSGWVRTRPMKGTAPILQDGQDEARAQALRQDPKNRAENVMIVDLLRNDLGKIAVTGGVRVPQPFQVDAFGSVWQMTTLVEAQLRPQTSLAAVFQAAFPCGSITGAPKRMSMQLIDGFETSPRGLYTGSLGYVEPCDGGLGFCGQLNVVIRTLQLRPHNIAQTSFSGSMGVGSGIVADSEAAAEYAECAWKAQFLRRLPLDFDLLETLGVVAGRCPLWLRHRQRLCQAATDLGFSLNEQDLDAQFQAMMAELPDGGAHRMRLTLSASGSLNWTVTPLLPLPQSPTRVVLADEVLPQRDLLRRYKTTARAAYDRVWQQAEQQGAFDGLLFNADGHLLEGGRSNVFVRVQGQWLTPDLDLDVLNGVMRQQVLADPQRHLQTERVQTARIDRAMLRTAEGIVLTNAVRGVLRVQLQV